MCSSTADRNVSPARQSRTAAIVRLELVFETAPDGRTYVASQHADYPFHVCRPHYLDHELPGMATLYMQSCSGGLFENDKLACRVTAGRGAAVHLTSQASTIVHSSRRGGQAEQAIVIGTEPNALLEYLPDPAILFPHSRYDMRLDLTLDRSASVMLSDAFIVHDPSGNGGVPGSIATTVHARLADGAVLASTRLRITGDDIRSGTPGVMGSWACHGTLMVFTRQVTSADLSSALRRALAAAPGVYAGVSALPNDAGAWMRCLAGEAVSLRGTMLSAWQECRRLLTGHVPSMRRK